MDYKNCITEIAKADNRDYITPEDVSKALEKFPVAGVRRDLLFVISKGTGFGIEDASLCAFAAVRDGKI